MAVQVSWAESAARDVERAVAYIAEDSPQYAANFAREIQQAAASLRTLATRGRIVPEVGREDIRELIVGAFRLIYRVDQHQHRVRIVAFIHGRRDFHRLPVDPAQDS